MKISSLLSPSLIRCRLQARSKDAALRELAELLQRRCPELSADGIVQSLQARERLGPFSIGKGVAFPHARTEQLKEFTVVVGGAPDGIDFKAADGQPVRLLILFVIPKKHSNLYLQAMAAFLNFFSLEENLARTLRAETPEALLSVFETAQASGRAGPTVKSVMEPPPPPFTIESPLSELLKAMRRPGCPAVPVVDAQGALTGEIRPAALLRAVSRDVLGSAMDPETLGRAADVDRFLSEHSATPIGTVPGLVANGTLPAVQQGEPIAAAAIRLARSNSDYAFVLDGRRLVGWVRGISLLSGDVQNKP